jgi:hypothetical protein
MVLGIDSTDNKVAMRVIEMASAFAAEQTRDDRQKPGRVRNQVEVAPARPSAFDIRDTISNDRSIERGRVAELGNSGNEMRLS